MKIPIVSMLVLDDNKSDKIISSYLKVNDDVEKLLDVMRSKLDNKYIKITTKEDLNNNKVIITAAHEELDIDI